MRGPTRFRPGSPPDKVEGKPGPFGVPANSNLQPRDVVTVGAAGAGAASVGAVATGAAAISAIAIGALAVGAFAVGRLSVGRARIGSPAIDELTVQRSTLPPDERANEPGWRSDR